MCKIQRARMTDILMGRLVGLALSLFLSPSLYLSVHMRVCWGWDWPELNFVFFCFFLAQTVLVKSWWIKDVGRGGKSSVFSSNKHFLLHPSTLAGNRKHTLNLVFHPPFFCQTDLWATSDRFHRATFTFQRAWVKDWKLQLAKFHQSVVSGSLASAVSSHYLIGIEMHLDRILSAL